MHIPVLLNETIALLDPKPGEFFVDGTLGAGGHFRALEEKVGSRGRVLGIDWEKTGENFADLPEILRAKNLPKPDGLLLDLGISSDQIESSGRGFSFWRDEPLLMNIHPETTPLYDHLRTLSEKEMTEIIRKYGEERYATRIARVIAEARKKAPIETSGQLAEIVKNAVPKNYERGRIHPATRTFQAFRIFVNRELENLERLLSALPALMAPGGRVAIISFHSLEDRLVKNAFRTLAKGKRIVLLTKKPVTPTDEEIILNPRSHSAKLRAIRFSLISKP